MHVWHLNKRWCLHVLRGHTDSVSAIELVTLPDGQILTADGAADGVNLTLPEPVRAWSPADPYVAPRPPECAQALCLPRSRMSGRKPLNIANERWNAADAEFPDGAGIDG